MPLTSFVHFIIPLEDIYGQNFNLLAGIVGIGKLLLAKSDFLIFVLTFLWYTVLVYILGLG